MKLYLAAPRGFCAGVDRAVDIVELALDLYGAPIYVKHAIVHNAHVVRRLERRGAIFVERVAEVPKGSRVIFSAHGSPPADYEEARERALEMIDATCPLVTKVHLEARRYAREGYEILLIGHHGHVEMRGTMGEAPSVTTLVETLDDLERFHPKAKKLAVLTQTTLSVDDTRTLLDAVRAKFPNAIFPPSKDICYATTNRQAAIKELAKKARLILVIGSQTSSNSNRLVEVARACGAAAYLIEDASRVQPEWLKGVGAVGISSGASAPEELVKALVEHLKKTYPIERVEIVEAIQESVFFDLPPELKTKARAINEHHPLLHKHHIEVGTTMRT